jgi:hypothetical protein
MGLTFPGFWLQNQNIQENHGSKILGLTKIKSLNLTHMHFEPNHHQTAPTPHSQQTNQPPHITQHYHTPNINQSSQHQTTKHHHQVALGGLVVSMLATGLKVSGFKPDRGRWILRVIKSVARLPSEGK